MTRAVGYRTGSGISKLVGCADNKVVKGVAFTHASCRSVAVSKGERVGVRDHWAIAAVWIRREVLASLRQVGQWVGNHLETEVEGMVCYSCYCPVDKLIHPPLQPFGCKWRGDAYR